MKTRVIRLVLTLASVAALAMSGGASLRGF
jgi:hypothetical protein